MKPKLDDLDRPLLIVSQAFEPAEIDRESEVWSLLSAEERRRAAATTQPEVQQQRVISRALTRRALSIVEPTVAPGDWTLGHEPSGRPVVEGSQRCLGLSFSLSHTRGRVACAVARGGEIGVDVEPIDRSLDPVRMARRYFGAAEADAIVALPEIDQRGVFLEWWTLKESFVKARGLALAQHLDRVCFSPRTDGRPGRFLPAAALEATPSDWRFLQVLVGGTHLVAVSLDAGSRLERPRVVVEASTDSANAEPALAVLRDDFLLGPAGE